MGCAGYVDRYVDAFEQQIMDAGGTLDRKRYCSTDEYRARNLEIEATGDWLLRESVMNITAAHEKGTPQLEVPKNIRRKEVWTRDQGEWPSKSR